ncbi:MAG: hypothetical protein O9346_16170 [Leptospiraceae bacterium]|nr:hypothetical protein [Leptospiraceae bacterium]MCZ8347949.1 hypothetical protein [Leptospiraceae bacterium]
MTTNPYKEVEHSTLANSPKLGVAILHNIQKEKLPHPLLLEMSGMTFKAQENLQMSDWKPNQRIEWISTYVDCSFDDTQDYLSITKKNILEIHTSLTYKSGLGSEVFHALTFSLIPKAFDYDLQMKSFFYDSDGFRIELVTTESYSIVDKQGMLVDHNAFDNNAEQQIQARLAEMIQRSHSMIREKKYSQTDYEPIERSKSTYPFLLSIDYISCYNKYQFDYGPGVSDTVLFDKKEYSFCRTELHFYNRTKKTISLDSKDFYLITKNDQTQALEDFNVLFVQHTGNGNFFRKRTTRNFSKRVTLKEIDLPSEESMELFFMLPKNFDNSNIRLRWKSPDSEPRIVEGWIGEVEIK